MKKVLIIRFSSIGDIIQCMSVIPALKEKNPTAEIHWVTRQDMAGLLKIDDRIDKIWEFDRKTKFSGLIKLAFRLKKEGFTHVYDAHNNIRSSILKLILSGCGIGSIFKKPAILTRSKHRIKRVLLFKFRINLFPKPNRSFESFQLPLKKWSINVPKDLAYQYHFPNTINERCSTLLQPLTEKSWITLVPSAAWPLKRWEINYWQKLIAALPNHHFVVLGGSHDYFCEELKSVDPARVENLAGKTSLMESLCIVQKSNLVISGDTGFLHAADLFDKETIALIGPTAFGFPSGKKTTTLEIDLPCRPCTKDGSTKCKNAIEKQCMRDIKPEWVADEALKKLRR